MIPLNTILCGDALETLRTMPDESVDCVVTSPPYYRLRDYRVDGQIGLEDTPEEFVRKITEVFKEVRRILKTEGSLYLNIGDTFATSGNSGSQRNLKQKDLIGIPWMVAFALRADGWYLRSDIIYAKRNCMPSSVKDRPTSSHEYVFLLTKSSRYYYDWEAIATEPSDSYKHDRRPKGVIRQKVNTRSKYHGEQCDPLIAEEFKKQNMVGRSDYTGFNDRYTPVKKVRRRDVWNLTVPGNREGHFAMFNPHLVKLCILAGCPPGGIVLDPFIGAGTVGLIAKELGRKYVGIDLNPEYVQIAQHRIK